MYSRKHKLQEKSVDPRYEYLYAESSDDEDRKSEIFATFIILRSDNTLIFKNLI